MTRRLLRLLSILPPAGLALFLGTLASALLHSTALKNGVCSGSAAVGGTTFNSGFIKIYDNSAGVPVNADAAVVGVLLSTNTLNATAFPAPVGGVLTANSIASATVAATGTAGYFRIVTATDTGAAVTTTQPRLQGSVGVSGADMSLNTLSFVAGSTITIPSTSYTAPP